MISRCSHPLCRTSLDDVPTECPHGLAFCDDCIWEEVCAECAVPPTRSAPVGDDLPAVTAAFDALKAQKPEQVGRPLGQPCRCGQPDDKPVGSPIPVLPLVDLTNAPGVVALDSQPIRRVCRACKHAIWPGYGCVTHRPTAGHAVRDYYHPACVEIRENR